MRLPKDMVRTISSIPRVFSNSRCFDLQKVKINVTHYTLMIICCRIRYILVEDFEATLYIHYNNVYIDLKIKQRCRTHKNVFHCISWAQ